MSELLLLLFHQSSLQYLSKLTSRLASVRLLFFPRCPAVPSGGKKIWFWVESDGLKSDFFKKYVLIHILYKSA